MIKFIALILYLLPTLSCASEIQSGIYDEAMVAYNHNNSQLSGYVNVNETKANGVGFSCAFYFSGKITNNKANVKSYFPGDLGNSKMEITKGTLTTNDGNINLILQNEPGGCGNLISGDKSGENGISYNFSLNNPAKNSWQEIAIIKSTKAYFYSAKNAPSHQKAYLVKGDGVGVISRDGEWLQVEYPWSSKPIIGWLKAADFYNLQ